MPSTLSTYPFSLGDPYSMYWVFAPMLVSHSRTARAVNSGPLSERMCRALTSVFVDDSHRTTVPGPVLDEVIAPEMVSPLRPQPDAGPVVQPQRSSPGLPGRHLQPLPPPDPLHSLVARLQPGTLERSGDPAVTVSMETGGQPRDVVGLGLLSSRTSGSPRWVERGCSSTLRAHCSDTPQGLPDMLVAQAAADGAQKFPSAAFLRIWLSRVRSATARSSRLFSVSSYFRRRAWSTLRPPYSACYRQRVCSETWMRRTASTTVLHEAMFTSAILSLLMISSSACFLLGMPHPPFCPES